MKLLKELNIKSEECLIIKDSLSGIQAAKNAIIEVLNILITRRNTYHGKYSL